jgi:enterochelin esterase-like enzyme
MHNPQRSPSVRSRRTFAGAAGALLATLAACPLLAACGSDFKKTVDALPPPRTEAGLERFEFRSSLLKKTMGMYVYLPPGYKPGTTWPVVYLLHGYRNDEIEWFEYHHLGEVADRLIAEGKMEPVIIVAPRMDNGWGLDSGEPEMDGPTPKTALYRGPYESYFLREVMYLAETRYGASRERAKRSLGGISMGGFSALHIGFRHPELFAKIGGHSPAIRGWDVPEFFIYSHERKRSEHDPIELARTRDLKGARVFLDCGEEDELFEGARELAGVLKERNVDVTFYAAPGGHNGAYWHANLERYLLFYAGK